MKIVHFLTSVVGVLFVLTATVGAQAQQQRRTPDEEVRAELRTLAPGERLRVIATVSVADSLIGQIGIKNAERESVAAAVAAIAQSGISVERSIPGTPLIVLEINQPELDALVEQGHIRAFEIDQLNEPFLQTLTPAIGGNVMHNNSARGLGTAIAILDSGVAQHPFFGTRLVAEACFSTNSAPNSLTSLCPNGLASDIGAGAAAPCPGSLCNHGTHVAGIAAGSAANMRGLAPDANIVGINVFSRLASAAGCAPETPPCLRALNSDILDALVHIRDRLLPGTSISAINLSLGGGAHSATCNGGNVGSMLQQLRAMGIAIIVASGNNSCKINGFSTGCTNAISYPACVAAALSVGATNNAAVPNTVQQFSNSAAILDVLAPGAPVFSSFPVNFGTMSGTSMAAPAVAGLIASLRSRFAVSVDKAESIVRQSGVAVTDTRNGLVHPRIDAAAAYTQLEAERPGTPFVWMKDGWNDSGAEPDPAMAGQAMSASPFIWVRNQNDGTNNHYQHQNPEFGQPNFVYAKVLNTGKMQGAGTLSLFVTPATPTPNLGSNWIRLVDKGLTVPPRTEVVYEFPWLTVPSPGHYCLLAKWTDNGGDTTLTFNGLDKAVRSSNDLIWKNINIIDLSKSNNESAKFELYKNPQGGNTTFVVDVGGSMPGAQLTMRLPIKALDALLKEPTLKNLAFKKEGPFAETIIALSDGVYYFPIPEEIYEDNSEQQSISIPTFYQLTEIGRSGKEIAVIVRQVEDITRHKMSGDGEIGALSYLVRR